MNRNTIRRKLGRSPFSLPVRPRVGSRLVRELAKALSWRAERRGMTWRVWLGGKWHFLGRTNLLAARRLLRLDHSVEAAKRDAKLRARLCAIDPEFGDRLDRARSREAWDRAAELEDKCHGVLAGHL